ncbi:sporulation protein [Candidatus Peregrinibacteria bacterium]|nr:MAG: sporulation protein [Candidatus Peregrinibacteria bacterium]
MNALKKFFAKIKLFFGIGTVKVLLEAPETFSAGDKSIEGTVTIIGKSDQKITKITVKMIEDYVKNAKNGQAQKKRFTLGEINVGKAFEIKQGEEKKIDFKLPFEMVKSTNDQLKDKGGALGALGGLGSMLDQEKSEYKLQAIADVEAASIDPMAEVWIQKK